MEEVNISRQQLYDLFWSEPLAAILKKYCISSSDLHKLCEAMNIPIPENGYWTKIQFGKQVTIEKLPDEYTGADEVTLKLRDEDCPESGKPISELEALIKEIESNPDLPLKVHDRLTNPDKLIVSAKESLPSKNNHFSRFEGMINAQWGELHIRVSPQNIEKALRFMDAFVKLIRARGHEIKIEYNHTYVVIGEEKIEVSLKEQMKYVKTGDEWNRINKKPTGILTFRKDGIYNKILANGKKPIETQLALILAKIELDALEEKNRRIEIHEYWEKEREKERIQNEIKERNEKEWSDFKKLLKRAKRWHKLKILREYIKDMEEKAISENGLTPDLIKDIEWSRQKADWYDPVIASKDEILGYYDKK